MRSAAQRNSGEFMESCVGVKKVTAVQTLQTPTFFHPHHNNHITSRPWPLHLAPLSHLPPSRFAAVAPAHVPKRVLWRWTQRATITSMPLLVERCLWMVWMLWTRHELTRNRLHSS